MALALRLIVAKALRRMGQLDEAEMHFKVLAGEFGQCWSLALSQLFFLF